MKGVAAVIDKNTGAIDWAKGGSYVFEWDPEGTFVVAIRHSSSKQRQALPGNVRITRAFKLHDTHLDQAAYVELKPTTYQLSELFEAETGPNLHVIRKLAAPEFQSLAQQVSEEVLQQRASLAEGTVKESADITKDVKDRKRSALTSKAREGRGRSRADKLRRRTINLIE